jgi:hypothetical protein
MLPFLLLGSGMYFPDFLHSEFLFLFPYPAQIGLGLDLSFPFFSYCSVIVHFCFPL